MTEQWKTGFQAGVLWAAAHVSGRFDEPTIAAELCREGGVTLRELQACDIADQAAVNKIISEFLAEPSAALQSATGEQ